MDEIDILPDWMTTPEIKMGTKITADNSDGGMHMHNFYEIFYILEGTITHVANGKQEVLETGDIVFLRLSDMHKFIREPNSVCKHRDIVIAPAQYEKSCNYIDKDLLNRIKISVSPPKAHLHLDELNYLEQRFTDFINLPNDDYKTKSSIVNILITDLLGYLIVSRHASSDKNYPAWFKELLSRFNMDLYIKSGLNSILNGFNYNQSYACRTFKKYMGVTMSQYLCQVRLQYASILLKSTNKNITEIANDIGFSSVSFFNTQFKKQYNITPKNYRKLAKNNQVLFCADPKK